MVGRPQSAVARHSRRASAHLPAIYVDFLGIPVHCLVYLSVINISMSVGPGKATIKLIVRV